MERNSNFSPKRKLRKPVPEKGQIIYFYRHDWLRNQIHYREIIKVIDVYSDFLLCLRANYRECYRISDFIIGRYTFDVVNYDEKESIDKQVANYYG